MIRDMQTLGNGAHGLARGGQRICMVSPYSLDRVSGITTVILDLGARLTERGCQVALATPGTHRRAPPGVMHWRVEGEEPFANLDLAWRTARELWKQRGEWGLVHVHQGHLQTLASALLSRILGRPVVTTIHAKPKHVGGLRGLVLKGSLRALLAFSTDRTYVSEHTRATVGSPGIVIPNGIDANRVRNALGDRQTLRAELSLDGFVVAFVGRRTASKGYFDLIEAVRRARKRGTMLAILAIGDVPPEERDRESRAAHDLGSQLRIIDRPDDYLRPLSAADAFALPSYAEGLPISVLEAMAAGLPVVASRVGGIPEVVHDGRHGLLVAPGDIDMLCQRLTSLLSDPNLRASLASAALERVRAFDANATADAYVRIYSRHDSRTGGHL